MKIDRNNLVAYWLLTCWIITILFTITPYSSAKFATTWASLLIVAIFVHRDSKLTIKKQPIKTSWFIFVIYTMFATIISMVIETYNKFNGTRMIFNSFIQHVFPLVIIYIATSYNIRNKFISLFKNFMFFSCTLGIFEYVFKIHLYERLITFEPAIENFIKYGNITESQPYRLTLFFYHPIFYSVILTVFLICLIYKPYKNKIFQSIAIVISIINLVLTQSRTGWFTFAFLFALYLFRERKLNLSKKNISSIIKIISILILLVILIYNFNRDIFNVMKEIIVERILQIETGAASGARITNLTLVKYAWTDWTVFLFGGGNNYAISLLQEHPTTGLWIRAIDNQFFTYILNYGVVGLTIFAVFTFNVLKNYFKSDDTNEKLISLAIIGIIFSSISYEYFGLNFITYLLFILVGMLKKQKETSKSIE